MTRIKIEVAIYRKFWQLDLLSVTITFILHVNFFINNLTVCRQLNRSIIINMSALEYNLVCAGGDGLKRKIEKPQLRRTPVPSCRKLTARPQAKDDQVKVKLEEAMQNLSSPNLRKFNRKRAQTVAEITPSKRRVPVEVGYVILFYLKAFL